MRATFFGIGLLTLCVGCNGGAPPDRVDVDVTTPGKVCEVHNIPLQEGVVPITYGLIRPTKEEIEAHQNLLPHAWSSYHDGCVVKEAKRARVSFCPECRKVEATWREAQERKMAPVRAHWERVSELVYNNPKFEEVYPYIDREHGPKVGLEGRVKSDEDLAELRRLVEATAPPQPVYWDVSVAP
jgi:hypothetical protein